MPPPAVRFTKRLLDIASAAAGLALTVPFFPLVAAAIRLDSPGPIFYSQKRARFLLERRPGDKVPRCTVFTMYKFRTMRTDAEKGTGAVFAAEGDPRVTAVGRILRKTRIDELPQLWNVLIGDMSLVGPRPERPEILVDLALAIPFFEERSRDVKPGLTGLAQISLGYTGAIPDDSELFPFRDVLQNPFKLDEAEGALADDLRAKLLYDLAYSAALETFSSFITTELSIMIKTPMVMVLGMGR